MRRAEEVHRRIGRDANARRPHDERRYTRGVQLGRGERRVWLADGTIRAADFKLTRQAAKCTSKGGHSPGSAGSG